MAKKSPTGSLQPAVPLAITPTSRPWTDDSYIYQLSLVLATATVSLRPRVFTFPSRLAENNSTQNESRNLKNRPTCCRFVRARPSAARAGADRGRCVAVCVRRVWRQLRRSGTCVGFRAVGRLGAVYIYQARCTAAAAAVEIKQRLDASRQGTVNHDELLASGRQG